MNDEDRQIREELSALLRATIPPLPALIAIPEPRGRLPWGRIAAAAAMLVALPAVLLLLPPREAGASAALSRRIAGVEARLALVHDDELRALLCREIELLRRELEMTGLSR